MLTKRFAGAVMTCVALQALGLAAYTASGNAPQETFRAGVDVIEVAVGVRDSDGHPVPDLVSTDFSITDDGVAQTILGVERISLPAIARPTVSTTGPGLTVPHDVTTNEQLAEARVFVLVLDALHVAPGRNLDVKANARQFVNEHAGPRDFVAVLSPGADASATQDFTSDKALVLAAIDRFTGTKLISATEELTQFSHSAVRQRDPSDEERADRVYALSNTLEAVAAHLSRIEGRRKGLLLFSEGVDYDITDVTGKQQRYAPDVARAMGRAVDALARTNTVLYTIDPRSLTSVQNDLLAHPIFDRSPGSETTLSERDFEREVSNSVRSLRDLAQATGGFLASDKGIRRAFEQIAEDTSQYYMLRFAPDHPPSRGEFRALRVRVSRPGLTVIARHGYVMPKLDVRADDRPTSSDEMMPPRAGRGMQPRVRPGLELPERDSSRARGVPDELSALLASALPKPGLSLRVQATPFRGTDKKSEVRLVIEVLGGGLQFVERNGRAEERIELALVTVDEHGRLANGRSTSIDLRLPPGELDRVRTTGVRWLSQLELPAGRHQLRVAARALGTETSGLVTHMVDVPRFERDRLAISGVTLTSLPSVLMPTRGERWLAGSLDMPPSAAREFVRGDRVTAAFELYVPPGSRESVESSAELIGAAGGVARRLERRRSGTLQSGHTEIAFELDTGTVPSGAYVLRIAAGPAGGGEHRERLVAIQIVEPGP
ncbi:MAG: VWA domain-containing protein [Acidobacteriota bacterium]